MRLTFVRWGGASGPAAHLERRAGDVAPYLLIHLSPTYSQTTPADVRVQELGAIFV